MNNLMLMLVACTKNKNGLYDCGSFGSNLDPSKYICRNSHALLSIIGWIIVIIKIIVPLIIIVLGILDVGKNSISSKPEDIKKSVMSLVWRIVAGVSIFLSTSVVFSIMTWITDFDKAKKDYGEDDATVCYACLLKPYDEKCANAKGMFD